MDRIDALINIDMKLFTSFCARLGFFREDRGFKSQHMTVLKQRLDHLLLPGCKVALPDIDDRVAQVLDGLHAIHGGLVQVAISKPLAVGFVGVLAVGPTVPLVAVELYHQTVGSYGKRQVGWDRARGWHVAIGAPACSGKDKLVAGDLLGDVAIVLVTDAWQTQLLLEIVHELASGLGCSMDTGDVLRMVDSAKAIFQSDCKTAVPLAVLVTHVLFASSPMLFAMLGRAPFSSKGRSCFAT